MNERAATTRYSLKIALSLGLAVALFIGLMQARWQPAAIGFAIAAVVTFAFLWLGWAWTYRRGPELELAPGETLVAHTMGGHQLGLELRGGRLFLTDRRLAFRTQKLVVQTVPWDALLMNVRGAEMFRTLGVIPNGLRLLMADGSRERFAVMGCREWAAAINEQLAPAGRPGAGR